MQICLRSRFLQYIVCRCFRGKADRWQGKRIYENKRRYSVVMKSFIWKQYTVQITKKNVKNTNVRIKRDNPHVILMSIPYSATYKAGLRALETPHIRHWLDNYERKLKQQPVPTDEEKFRKELEKEKMAPSHRLIEIFPFFVLQLPHWDFVLRIVTLLLQTPRIGSHFRNIPGSSSRSRSR